MKFFAEHLKFLSLKFFRRFFAMAHGFSFLAAATTGASSSVSRLIKGAAPEGGEIVTHRAHCGESLGPF